MSNENVSEDDAREAIAACLMRFAGYKKSRARAVARALMHRLPEPVAYHDKDQPRGIAWCPGYPAALPDISPLYTISAIGTEVSDGPACENCHANVAPEYRCKDCPRGVSGTAGGQQ